jgi:hypothetical protein
MSKFTKLDTMLISEAYSAQLLLESAPYMTIAEIQSKLPYMTIAEAQIIEEMFGKLGQKIGQVASGIGSVAGAAGRGLKSAGQAVGKAIGNAGQTARQVGSGIASAAGQVGSNVKNMYQAGVDSKQSEDAIENARTATQELIDLVTQAQQSGLIKAQKAVSDMTMAEIMQELVTAKESAGTFQAAADKTGFTGGAGAAFKKGFQGAGQQGAAPAGAAQTP